RPQVTGRSDFCDSERAVGVGRSTDSRTAAAARRVVSPFDAALTGNATDTVGLEGGSHRQPNGRWTCYWAAGPHRSESRLLDDGDELVDNASTNFTVTLEFQKRTELSTLDLGLYRLLDPNAVGFLVERNVLRVRFARQLSERMRVGFGFSAVDMGALERENVRDRQYLRADVDIEWAFTRQWSFTARVGAVDQEFSGQQLDGTANVLSVGAVFRGLSRTATP